MIARYARLLLVFAKVETQYELEYRTNLLFSVLQQVMIMVTSIGAMLILFSYTTTLNGWSVAEMLVLLGVFYMVQGIGDTLFGPSFERLLEHIRLGTLDFTLLKPANGQFLVSTRHVKLRNSAQLALGIAVLIVGASRLETPLGAAQVVGFVIALGCGFALMYALLLVLSTLAFWFVRVENLLVIYGAFVDASRFPVEIYPGWLRLTLSSIAPIGIAVTVPAQALAGRVDALGVVALGAAAVTAWLFSAWFWRRGLRAYTGASA